jgi:bla regulator protein BlaR1
MTALLFSTVSSSLLAAANRCFTGAAHPLANHLWQSTVFCAIAAGLALALKKNQARARYWIWMSASVKLLLPVAMFAGLASHWVQPRTAVVPATSVAYSTVENFDEPFTSRDAVAMSIPQAPAVTLLVEVREWLPLSIAMLWFAGFAMVLTLWCVRWRRVAKAMRAAIPVLAGREFDLLRRMEHAAGLYRPIELRTSAESMEPGVFGIMCPVLAWPAAISARLDDAQLEAVLAHEVCHVCRRDNLTATLHMFVEALFWFHPMVWWVGARLVAERERACDEQVLEICGQPAAYAESILKVCEYCVQTPLECISGVTGADLKRRVIEIMTARTARKLTLGKKLLLAATAMLVAAVPIVLGQAQAARRLGALMMTPPPVQELFVQASEQAESKPVEDVSAQHDAPDAAAAEASDHTFEVATIRPANRNDGRHFFGFRLVAAGRYSASAVSLQSLVWNAYVGGQTMQRVEGGPAWAKSDQFDLNAKLDDADMVGWDKLTDGQRRDRVRPLLRNLLEQRFKLKMHTEMTLTPVYALVQAKGGAKMKEVSAPAPIEGDPIEAMTKQIAENPTQALPGNIMCTGNTCTGVAVKMEGAVGQIGGSAHADRIVIDDTGLKGYYDFKFTQPSYNAPDAMAHVEDDLGLKFESRKVMMKTYVIDSAEKPSVDGSEVTSSPALQTNSVGRGDAAGKEADKIASSSPSLKFDVVSVKPNNSGEANVRMNMLPDGIRLLNVTPETVIREAYLLDYSEQLQNLPGWTATARFDIEAKVAGSDVAAFHMLKFDQVREMLRPILADRFNLSAHSETKLLPVYDLVIAKGGPKFKEGKPDAAHPDGMLDRGGNHIAMQGLPMGSLRFALMRQLGRTVEDETGLTATYDLKLVWTSDDGALATPISQAAQQAEEPTEADGLSIFTAIQEQLGLRLVSAKGPVECIIVDRVELPTKN